MRVSLILLTSLLLAPSANAKRTTWIDSYVKAYKAGKRADSISAKQCARVLETARGFVKNKLRYDSAYFQISYPNGDIPAGKGVCTDVVVRAARVAGLDLQRLVHEDMVRAKAHYPPLWNLTKPDPNIDHRRVPNLLAWFERNGKRLALSKDAADFKPCDIVAWELDGGVTHIGLVTDRKSREGVPLVIHHFGGRLPAEEDILLQWRMIGHFGI